MAIVVSGQGKRMRSNTPVLSPSEMFSAIFEEHEGKSMSPGVPALVCRAVPELTPDCTRQSVEAQHTTIAANRAEYANTALGLQ